MKRSLYGVSILTLAGLYGLLAGVLIIAFVIAAFRWHYKEARNLIALLKPLGYKPERLGIRLAAYKQNTLILYLHHPIPCCLNVLSQSLPDLNALCPSRNFFRLDNVTHLNRFGLRLHISILILRLRGTLASFFTTGVCSLTYAR